MKNQTSKPLNEQAEEKKKEPTVKVTGIAPKLMTKAKPTAFHPEQANNEDIDSLDDQNFDSVVSVKRAGKSKHKPNASITSMNQRE